MKTWIISFVILALVSTSGAIYYNMVQERKRVELLVENNATLQANNQTLSDANQTNLNTIVELNQTFEEVQQNFDQVQSEFQLIREQNNELKERLGRHELGALASARPQLVERTINNASANALRCFELLSGAPLTESEKNASTARQFNSECPFLWPSSSN